MEPKEIWVVERDNGTWWNFEFAADDKQEADTFVRGNGAWRYRVRRYIPAENEDRECICGHWQQEHRGKRLECLHGRFPPTQSRTNSYETCTCAEYKHNGGPA